MAIILDADVIIRGEKGTFDLRGWLATNASQEFEVAAIRGTRRVQRDRPIGARRRRFSRLDPVRWPWLG